MWPRRIPSRRVRFGQEAGSAAVEFAVVAVPVIFLVLGTFDYFAASYQTANLAGAARAIAELARNSANCVTDVTSSECRTEITTLISKMATNASATNNTLSSLSCCIGGAPAVTSANPLQATNAPKVVYSCASQNILTETPPSSCTPDPRVVQYVQVTVQKPLPKLFSWDPWSAVIPLTARMALRTQ
jgi:Flp pilus assembly protein TadG